MIKVKSLIKSYGDVQAVKGISFNVEKGEIYAFLGENGAGKSTTINILCTMLKKDSGEVSINDYNLDKQDNEIRNSIGVVFQGSYLDKRLTVYENLYTRGILYGYTEKEIKDRINKVEERLNMGEFIKRRYDKLSGGQRRRADIARAILHNPKVLFLDEPTTGLDPATRIIVWDTVKELKNEWGITIFFSTHYMEETEIADKIAIIKKGEIAVIGTPYGLKQKYSKDTLNIETSNNPYLIEFLDKGGYDYYKSNNHISIKLDNSLLSLPILEHIKKDLLSYEVKKGNMDDVFINVTDDNFIIERENNE